MRDSLKRRKQIRGYAEKPKSDRVGKAIGRIRIWAFICVVPCLLFVALLYLIKLRGQKASVPGELVQPMSMGPREAQIQSATTTRELNTQGLETYRNDAYGFAFEYPGTWGKVAFAEASPKQRRGDAAELTKLPTPDSGVIFRGSFEGKKYCEFGGLSDDYSYPSETPIFAWKPSGGKYYDVSSGAGKAYVSEVTPEQVSNDNELLGSLGGGVLFVNIELPGPVVHSIGFFCYGTGQDGQVLDSDRNEMKIITQTFQYVPTIK